MDQKLYSNISALHLVDKYIPYLDDYKIHKGIPALPFSRLHITTQKPLGEKYVPNPVTIGDKIRNRRLELGLLQKEVAEKIGVTEDCITLWEGNKSQPHIQYYPKLIEFLGFMPIEIDTSVITGKVKRYRYMHGLTQEKLASMLQVDESTIFHFEKGTHTPHPVTMNKITSLLTDKIL